MASEENKIDKLTIKIPRKLIQGGLTNEEFDPKCLRDWRLQHHIPTNYAMKWKNFEKVGNDSKFTDIRSKMDKTIKAEGKKLTGGVVLCPSRDTGANRQFNQNNLDECFEINSFYFLYDRENITNETIDFIVYWIPIDIIKKWYCEYGNGKGKITFTNLKKCFENIKFNETNWDRTL